MARLAAFWGAFTVRLLGNWEVSQGSINDDLAYMLVFRSVAAFGAGRILGPDPYIDQHEIGG